GAAGAAHTGAAHTGAAHTGAAHTEAVHTRAAHHGHPGTSPGTAGATVGDGPLHLRTDEDRGELDTRGAAALTVLAALAVLTVRAASVDLRAMVFVIGH